MGLYLRSGSPYYWYNFHREGQKVNKSTGVTDKKLAQKIFEKALNDFNSEKLGFTPSSITLKELTNKWLEHTAHTSQRLTPMDNHYHIGVLLKFFGANTKAVDITPKKIEEFRINRKNEDIADSTINRNCSFLRAAYNLAYRDNLLKHNPFKQIKFYNEKENERARFLTVSEMDRLIFHSNDKIRPLVVLALETGMRKGELLRLEWSNVDMIRNYIRVVRSKGGKPRVIPLTDKARRLLEGINNKKQCVFISQKWGFYRDSWNNAVKGSNLNDFRFHDLRHTFASRLVEKGIDLYQVALLLGHSSLKMTQRYSHLSPEGLQKTINKLNTNYCNSTTMENNGNDKLTNHIDFSH